MNKLREASDFWSLLARGERGQQIALIKTASRKQILVLKEIVVNLLRGNIDIPAQQKSKLQKYKSFLRNFARKHVSKKSILASLRVIVQLLVCVLPLIQRSL